MNIHFKNLFFGVLGVLLIVFAITRILKLYLPSSIFGSVAMIALGVYLIIGAVRPKRQ